MKAYDVTRFTRTCPASLEIWAVPGRDCAALWRSPATIKRYLKTTTRGRTVRPKAISGSASEKTGTQVEASVLPQLQIK